jgi:acyl-CoA thioesterase YciA
MTEATVGRLTTRVVAMPSDSNPAGDISGGWVLAQMDMAAAICAGQRAQTRTVTVALDGMSFIRPVKVGDILGVYTQVESIGRTSMLIHVEAWVRRAYIGNREKVTEGKFRFVALDAMGVPTPVPPEESLPDYAKEHLR